MIDRIAADFNKYVQEGISTFIAEFWREPKLSHVCLKFKNMADYNSHVTAAAALGTVHKEQFNGKEISWCKLAQPLHAQSVSVEWLEFVEPKEPAAVTGVASLGYVAPGIISVLKRPSQDNAVVFRYMPKAVHPV